MRLEKVFLIILCAFAVVGCTTTGKFVVPPDTDLYIHDRPEPVDVAADGTVVTRPFFWTAMGVPPNGGVEYRLEKDGQVVKDGRLRANFRWQSIFWPPYAIIYWPTGLNPNITYDLVNDTQE